MLRPERVSSSAQGDDTAATAEVSRILVNGAVAGGVAGHNIESGSTLNTVAGGVGGGAVGAAAGSLVKDKVLVEAVTLSYKEGKHVFSSTQVGKSCMFTPGLAVIISMGKDETRIQPNATCPEKK